jgi:hypothetical protein
LPFVACATYYTNLFAKIATLEAANAADTTTAAAAKEEKKDIKIKNRKVSA